MAAASTVVTAADVSLGSFAASLPFVTEFTSAIEWSEKEIVLVVDARRRTLALDALVVQLPFFSFFFFFPPTPRKSN